MTLFPLFTIHTIFCDSVYVDLEEVFSTSLQDPPKSLKPLRKRLLFFFRSPRSCCTTSPCLYSASSQESVKSSGHAGRREMAFGQEPALLPECQHFEWTSFSLHHPCLPFLEAATPEPVTFIHCLYWKKNNAGEGEKTSYLPKLFLRAN